MRIALALGLLCHALTGFAATAEERIRVSQAAAAVYRVDAFYSEERSGSGSAVQISPGRFVTSCHLTRDAKGIRIGRGAKTWPAYWQYKDIEHDLCVIAVRDGPIHVAQLAKTSELRVGQEVFAVGFPAHQWRINIQMGHVQALYDFDDAKVVRTDAAFARGESGGALFDAQGRVVGVLTFKAAGRVGFYFAVPTEWVEQVEQKAANSPSPQDAMAFWERTPEVAPIFLNAAALEAGERWEDLINVARDWSASDNANPEPWVALGKALYRVSRADDAIGALRKAVELNPQHVEGWYQLGLAYRELNQSEELARVRLVLDDLSPSRAAQLQCTAC